MGHAERNNLILQLMAKRTTAAIASKKTAREFLCGGEIYTKEGLIRKEYREPTKTAS